MRSVLLLADNDVKFREAWGAVLSNAEYEVRLAANPQEARNILRDVGIDLAILDLRLVDDNDENDVSGLEIATDKTFRNIAKIILTAYKTSPENLRKALGLTLDDLPPAAAWVGKDEGPEALLKVIRDTLETWPRLRMSTIKVSEQIKADHKIARQQAKLNYLAAAIVSILGFLLILAGIYLAWFTELSIGIVGTTSGIILQVLGYLFFKRLDLANERMDIYHRELLQTYWLELLLAACEQLPFEKQVVSTERVIYAAMHSWFLPRQKVKTPAVIQQQDLQDQRG